MNDENKPLIQATSIDGSNIIALDSVGFAREVSKQAQKLYAINKQLAFDYLQCITGIVIKMDNPQASFDNSHHHTDE